MAKPHKTDSHAARPASASRTRPIQSRAAELDRIIHEPVRLGIVSALAGCDSMTFNELKELLRTTDGNLSVHARKLEENDYIDCEKHFEGRIPRTSFKLTSQGKRALETYLHHMEALIRATRAE